MPGMDRRWARRAQCPRAQQDLRSTRALNGRGHCIGGSPGIHAGEDVPFFHCTTYGVLRSPATRRVWLAPSPAETARVMAATLSPVGAHRGGFPPEETLFPEKEDADG